MGAVGYTGGDPNKVDVAGDTMTGPLVLPGDPSSPLEAATRQFVLDNAGGGGGGGSTPSGTVVAETSYGQAPTAGVASTHSRGDHSHGTPALGTTASTAAAGNHGHTGVYDPAGTAAVAVAAHDADTTNVHGIADTANLVLTNDSRLSDSRTPTVHASTHASAGSDPVILAQSQVTGLTSALSGKQDADGDLTTIAAIDTSTAGVLATDGAGWIRKSYAALKTALGLVKADVGLGNVDNTSDADKPVSTATQTALNAKVTGPTSATDNAVTRYDATTGKLIQNSLIQLTDIGTFILPALTGAAHANGQLYYNTTDRSLVFHNAESDVEMNVGQELWLVVRNETGSSIVNGSAVYINGTHATGVPTIALAQANNEITAVCTGLTTHTIENNTYGFVTTDGIVHGLDTSAFSGGNVLYLSATTPGALTTTRPSAPNIEFRIGVVTRANPSQGSINVDPGVRRLGNGTANQVYGMNNAGNDNEWKTFTAGSGIVVSGGPGAIIISASGGGGSATGYESGVSPKSGGWYRAPGDGPVGSNYTVAVGSAIFVPFVLAKTTTFDRLGVDVAVAGAAGAVVRLGIFANNTDGEPGTLIIDAGTVDVTTTGGKVTTAFSQSLSPGLYWFCAVGQVAGTTQLRATVSGQKQTRYFGAATAMFTGTEAGVSLVATGITGALASNPSITDNDRGVIIGIHAA